MEHLLGQVGEAQVGAVPSVYGTPWLAFAGTETSEQAHVDDCRGNLEIRRRLGDEAQHCSGINNGSASSLDRSSSGYGLYAKGVA